MSICGCFQRLVATDKRQLRDKGRMVKGPRCYGYQSTCCVNQLLGSLKMHFIAADLSTSAGATAVIREISSTFGAVDILINNMGGSETRLVGLAC